MAQGLQGEKKRNIATIIIYVMLLGAVATYAMPFLKFDVPPLGSKTLSVQEIINVIPKSFAPKEKKSSFNIKLDHDFVDVLMKILPKDEKTDKPKKLSLSFILGILVPVALALTYVLVLLSFLAAPFKNKLLPTLTGFGTLTAGYSLVGIYYLGLAAQNAFDKAVDNASEGALGIIAKNFVPKIAIVPESGLFTLCGLVLALYFVSLFRGTKN